MATLAVKMWEVFFPVKKTFKERNGLILYLNCKVQYICDASVSSDDN